ncbi:MAG: hypothetical protein AMJ61_16590 [Desulfobacterales bacterium SG8_35_2]|nr:MAG: hypothetical protein AMJ61_16590 [Desulfobacterales bacterium SG8_35_2]
MKKLGEYLIENDICNESLLDNALQEQEQLQSQGIFKPLGSVLIDSHDISPQDVDKAICLMHLNVLSRSVFFQNITKETLLKTLDGAQFRIVPEDSVIFNQGQEPESFFIVISGNVKIFKTSADGQESIVASSRTSRIPPLPKPQHQRVCLLFQKKNSTT